MRKTTASEISGSADAFSEVCRAIASLGSGAEVQKFMEELCTPT